MLDDELTEIEVSLDGSWRLKSKDGINGSEFPWHSPNDSFSDPNLNANLHLNQIESEVNKPDKYEDSLTPVGYEVPIMDENASGSLIGENAKFCVESGSCSWSQSDNQFNPNSTCNLSTLVTHPYMEKGGIMGDGRSADLRTLRNVSPNQESMSTPRLGGNMSMQGGTHQDDWISLSLAAGIVHPIPDLVNDSLSAIHKMSAMASYGLPPNSGLPSFCSFMIVSNSLLLCAS
jgi:hypothetical protein